MNSEEQAFLKSLLANKMCSPMRTSRAKIPESKMISPLIRRNISIFDTVNKINKFNLNSTKPSADGDRLTEFEVLDFLGKIPNYESYVLKWFKQFKSVDRNLMAAIMKKMTTMDMSDHEYCKELDKQLGLFLAGAATQGLLSSIDTNERHIKITDDDSDESWCKNVFDLQFDIEESKRQTKMLTTMFNTETGEDHSLKRILVRIGNTNITINANKVPYAVEYPPTGIDDMTKQKMGFFLSPICFLPLDLVNKLKGKNMASLMRRMLRTTRWSLNYMEFVSKEVEKFVMAQSKPY
ncbi:PREDICTED: uncharacterized protein LOC108565019 [Nicrophorus vespilloides]|uniref:Uncharacterized protein LOC108565019 n=1 Tax=Nicrophorus vespilloides TaxID=110193 RepID=A0ABM1MYU1_NICVS|nr:PREDICTED: uncharacterized protein LOC108565019 [Nicrophorus vespilloides]